MIQAWQITPTGNLDLSLKAASLDEITRRLPEGYYSTFRTFGGGRRVLGLSDHLRRLYDPVTAPEVDESFLRRQLLRLLQPYRHAEARVRVMMTKSGEVYLALEPLSPPPRTIYEKGVRAETTELHRDQPRLKSTAFITLSDAERKHIAEAGIFEALLVKNGKILEGMTSNFFYVRGDALAKRGRSADIPSYLYTAQDDILPGITRQTVIDVASGRGVEVRYEPLERNQLDSIDEAFITSSSRGIVPIVQIDGVTIGQGSPGRLTKELSAAYNRYVIDKAEKIVPVE